MRHCDQRATCSCTCLALALDRISRLVDCIVINYIAASPAQAVRQGAIGLRYIPAAVAIVAVRWQIG